MMKTTHRLWLLCSVLFIGYSPLQAQTKDVYPAAPGKLVLRSLGATIGAGVADMNLKALNSRLQVLEIGQLDGTLSVINLSVYAGFNGGFGLSADVNLGTSSGGAYTIPIPCSS
ncbi:hypothetical protein [Pontibacter chitinilyticus]|uniref:hypothetical protein n=1 Tax=Pontibacter chitinilyticus TaxID=2674989 RepID=UPI00321B17A0